jgi:hypothetical protein
MKISDIEKRHLVEELEYLSKKIEESRDFPVANFYFSAAYGAFDKILKSDYSRSILFTEEILQMAYLRTTSLLQDANLQKVIGQERMMRIMMQIAKDIRDLAVNIMKGSDTIEKLSEIVELAYTLTGPGIYLRDMGKIKV